MWANGRRGWLAGALVEVFDPNAAGVVLVGAVGPVLRAPVFDGGGSFTRR